VCVFHVCFFWCAPSARSFLSRVPDRSTSFSLPPLDPPGKVVAFNPPPLFPLAPSSSSSSSSSFSAPPPSGEKNEGPKHTTAAAHAAFNPLPRVYDRKLEKTLPHATLSSLRFRFRFRFVHHTAPRFVLASPLSHPLKCSADPTSSLLQRRLLPLFPNPTLPIRKFGRKASQKKLGARQTTQEREERVPSHAPSQNTHTLVLLVTTNDLDGDK
jgi:hypothetical protein